MHPLRSTGSWLPFDVDDDLRSGYMCAQGLRIAVAVGARVAGERGKVVENERDVLDVALAAFRLRERMRAGRQTCQVLTRIFRRSQNVRAP
jgi:hypothetical protein